MSGLRMAACATCAFLLLAPAVASSANYSVGIGDCYGYRSCFTPAALLIRPGDSVTFYVYQEDVGDIRPHNVVAEDGSFRCARGCDHEGGDGTPRNWQSQWSFTRTFNVPGVVQYHDEGTGVGGVIIVRDAPFIVGPGVTGAWHEPALPGHGMFVEVLPDNRLLVAWLSFDWVRSEQAWFIGVGQYGGGIAVIDSLEQPTGSRWPYGYPSPASNTIVKNRWGSLTLTFLDCSNVVAAFDSERGYGKGTAYLRRLTQPAGVACP